MLPPPELPNTQFSQVRCTGHIGVPCEIGKSRKTCIYPFPPCWSKSAFIDSFWINTITRSPRTLGYDTKTIFLMCPLGESPRRVRVMRSAASLVYPSLYAFPA
jgi:hypothetical protein